MIPTWELQYLTTHSALLEILKLQLGTKFLLKEELCYTLQMLTVLVK